VKKPKQTATKQRPKRSKVASHSWEIGQKTDSAIKSGLYCIFFSLRVRDVAYFYFRSKIWRRHTRLRFPITHGNFGDSWTWQIIGLLIFA